MEQAVVNATPDGTHDFLRIENLGIDIIPPAPFSERVFNVPDTLHGMGDEVPAICTSALHKTISRCADDLPGVIMTTADLREQKNTTEKLVTAWIVHAFEHGDDNRKYEAIEVIKYTPEADRTGLIEQVLTSPDSSYFLKCAAINVIRDAPEADRTRLIEQVLTASGGSDYSKYAAINAIKYAPEADRTRLIEQALAASGSSDFLKPVIVDAIQYVSEADQLRFYRLVSSSEPKPTPTEPLTKSPLHDVAQPNEVVTFHKTGSETYILPEEHEASVRLISPQSAAAWLHANNSWDKWRDAGFEYVPIEPILAVKPVSDTHTVAMTTTNLRGRPLDYATEYFGHFAKRLQQNKDDIKQTLVEIGIWHGHLHDKNFVVVPYVQQDGEVDYSKCPRLYVIDFDRALIVKK